MGSLNKVMLIGRLGRDPELRYTSNGTPVATLSVATDESYMDKASGSRVEKTEWHRVNVWGRTAENCSNYLSKGRLVYVEGSLQTRKWQDQQGQDRYTTEIKAMTVHFLDSKAGGGGGDFSGDPGGYEDEGYAPPQNARPAQGRQQNFRQGGGQGGGQGGKQGGRQAPPPQGPDEDLGPAFPSEAGGMDDVPF